MDSVWIMECTRDQVGSKKSFHAKDLAGYTSDINKAHRFSEDEVLRFGCRDIDVPWPLTYIEKRQNLYVDCQVLGRGNPDVRVSPTDRWVVQQPGDWDGNDIFFVGPDGRTDQFSNASIMDLSAALALGGCVKSFEYLESIAVHRVRTTDCNHARAVKGTRITPCKKRKKPRREPLRCEQCGQFRSKNDQNPYEYCWRCEA